MPQPYSWAPVEPCNELLGETCSMRRVGDFTNCELGTLFVMTLQYSDAIYIQAFPRECTESFLEGHTRAFEFLGGVPTRISYDNSKIAVAKNGVPPIDD